MGPAFSSFLDHLLWSWASTRGELSLLLRSRTESSVFVLLPTKSKIEVSLIVVFSTEFETRFSTKPNLPKKLLTHEKSHPRFASQSSCLFPNRHKQMRHAKSPAQQKERTPQAARLLKPRVIWSSSGIRHRLG